MADSTLAAIQKMVRRITQSTSENLLSTFDLNQYINTFVLNDFPQNLRLFSLRTILTFYTQPNVATYSTVDAPPTDPLYNFNNKYTAVHEPVYIAGVRASYTQYRDIFFGSFPQTNFVFYTLQFGTGTPGPFVGTLTSVPVLQNNVIFTINDTDGTSMVLVDQPVNNVTGGLYVANNFAVQYGTINYITGAYNLSFPRATQVGAPLVAETIPYAPALPVMMLYFDNQFTLAPVPDKTYQVQIEADIIPTELLAQDQNPQTNQWWQYIALGAAIKVFRDRLDMDSISLIMPEYQHQEMLVQRPTLMLRVNERTETIYSPNNQNTNNWFWGRWPY